MLRPLHVLLRSHRRRAHVSFEEVATTSSERKQLPQMDDVTAASGGRPPMSSLEVPVTTDRSCAAVQYIRMSTDHQDLSPEVQTVAIQAYAARNGLAVIDTFLDAGRSGLTLHKRPAMKRLLHEVTHADRTFSIVLVYDISRWGRFQDPDASAYYEYHCRLHGVDVRYVQEPFAISDSPLGTLFKSMKRAMAAEFSRELGIKTRAGQAAALSMGFHLGTLPCLGISRVAVSKADASERRLKAGEHKAGQREHVRWVRGPDQEVDAVHRLFDVYANSEISVVQLARQLAREGTRTSEGQPITEWMLYSLLHCEALVGNFVWGRAENKKRRSEEDDRFKRVNGFMEPIVERELFEAVQAKLARRKHVILTRQVLLEQLRAGLAQNPRLNASNLQAYGCPCRESYIKHFGSMRAAWMEAGAVYPPATDYAAMEHSAKAGAEMCQKIASTLVAAGVDCRRHTREDRRGQTLLINGRTVLRVQLIWRRPRNSSVQWCLRKLYKGHFDWALVVRLQDDDVPKDSLLLTRAQYFAQGVWMPETLPRLWPVYQSTEELAPLFAGLE
jgi:DNA invertase Pin-like site-specific DNA recombinase